MMTDDGLKKMEAAEAALERAYRDFGEAMTESDVARKLDLLALGLRGLTGQVADIVKDAVAEEKSTRRGNVAGAFRPKGHW